MIGAGSLITPHLSFQVPGFVCLFSCWQMQKGKGTREKRFRAGSQHVSCKTTTSTYPPRPPRPPRRPDPIRSLQLHLASLADWSSSTIMSESLVARRTQFSSCDECRRSRVACDAHSRRNTVGDPSTPCTRCLNRNRSCTFNVCLIIQLQSPMDTTLG